MIKSSRFLSAVLAGSLLAASACGSDRDSDRWATTENTNVQIDWDKVNEAYKTAEGPEDLEKKINEIYEGDEIISIAVQDEDAKTQVVTGFFDKNTSGKVDEGEKIFTIKREIKGEGQGEIQTVGHGPYYGYSSPIMSIATGMILGSMLSSAFSPRYVPVYTTPYTTTAARHGSLSAQRSSYRASNPERFSKPSRTGRTYGGGTRSGGSRPSGRSGGGARFGLARAGRVTRPQRLAE